MRRRTFLQGAAIVGVAAFAADRRLRIAPSPVEVTYPGLVAGQALRDAREFPTP